MFVVHHSQKQSRTDSASPKTQRMAAGTAPGRAADVGALSACRCPASATRRIFAVVMMEDQKRPRKCGHFEGKEILP